MSDYQHLTQQEGYNLISEKSGQASKLMSECEKIADELGLAFSVYMINFRNRYESEDYSEKLKQYRETNPHVAWDNYENLTESEQEFLDNEGGGGSGYGGWQMSGC